MKFPTKEQTKEWLKNPYNLLFIIILIFTIGIRFYYFQLTIDQPFWWDESEYLSAGKNFAGIVDYQLHEQRNALFPLVISLFYRMGISDEHILRFFLLFIPSIIVILLIYFCVREMYEDRRIALISMILGTVLWEHLFYSNRFHTENLSLIFGFLGILLTFKLYLKKENFWFFKEKYAIIYIMLCEVLAFLFRTGNIVFIPIVLLFIVLIGKLNLFKRKEVFYGGLLMGILIIIQLVYNYISHGDFIKGYLTYVGIGRAPAWNSLLIFKGFLESLNPEIPSILYYIFFIGCLLILIKLILNKNKILKLEDNKEELELKSDIFNLFTLLIVLFMFIFVLREPKYEFRWLFPLIIAMFVFIAKGIIITAEYIQYFITNKYKYITGIIILILLIPGIYYELQHSDMIIKIKLESYSQVRDAGMWIKENSNNEDIIISNSQPQTTYYSERHTLSFVENETGLYSLINKEKPKFLTVSIFEVHPEYIFSTTQNRTDIFTPVNAFYLDKERKQLALIIYQINYNNLKINKTNA